MLVLYSNKREILRKANILKSYYFTSLLKGFGFSCSLLNETFPIFLSLNVFISAMVVFISLSEKRKNNYHWRRVMFPPQKQRCKRGVNKNRECKQSGNPPPFPSLPPPPFLPNLPPCLLFHSFPNVAL